MVHLSETIDDALAVARRRAERPVILRVQAQEAHGAGMAFYHEGKVYLASHIPAQFLSVEPLPTDLESPSTDA